jgi:ABC-type bacteriocin/lantibiotic exporter with double-glycine peptidase domain
VKILEAIYTHLHENTLGDNVASTMGGMLVANFANKVNISHLLDVAFYSFVGGIFGLLGKVILQWIIDFIIKKTKK